MTDDKPSGGVTPPNAIRRFYTDVGVRPAEGAGWQVTLDNRPIRTPKRQPLDVPAETVAEAVAAEWRAQGPNVLPQTMPMTTLTNSAIDLVRPDPGPAIAEILAYLGSDLVCYRAESPASLVARQSAAWNPLVDWLGTETGVRLVVSEGIVHHPQPGTLLEIVQERLAAEDPFTLTALHSMTTLTGSAVIALAVLGRKITADEGWSAAHVDEIWQAEQWGEDVEAAARLAARRRDFQAAATLLELLHG